MGAPVYADMTVVSIPALGMEAFLLFLHWHWELHPTPFGLLKTTTQKVHNGAIIALFLRSWARSGVWLFAGFSELLQLGECLCPHQDEKRRDQGLTSGLGKVEAGGWAGLKAQAARVGVPVCLDSMWEAGGFSQHLLSLPGLVPHVLASIFFDSGWEWSPSLGSLGFRVKREKKLNRHKVFSFDFPEANEVLSSLTPII